MFINSWFQELISLNSHKQNERCIHLLIVFLVLYYRQLCISQWFQGQRCNSCQYSWCGRLAIWLCHQVSALIVHTNHSGTDSSMIYISKLAFFTFEVNKFLKWGYIVLVHLFTSVFNHEVALGNFFNTQIYVNWKGTLTLERDWP